MNYKCILMMCLHISSIYSVPVKLHIMSPQYGMQPQSLLPIQNPFLRQALPYFQGPNVYSQQPILLLLPNIAATAEDRYANLNEEDINKLKSDKGYTDENKEAIILNAESKEDVRKPAFIMPPGARLSIGDIISYIPFLPIEINVPDTIAWIAGLFPGNWFGRPGEKPENIKRLSNKGPMPILVIPAPMIQ